jgi:hypothetical protein
MTVTPRLRYGREGATMSILQEGGCLDRCKEKNISGPYWGSGPEKMDVGTNFTLGCCTATDSTVTTPSTDQWLSHYHRGLEIKLYAEYLFGRLSHVVAVFTVQN